MYFMAHGGMQWYGKGLVHDSGVVWQGCGMTLWCGCTGGRCLGLHWEDPRDQAQRGGRQAGGWLLFDAALVWVWFGFLSGFGFGLFWYNVGVVCPWLSVGGSGYCTGPKSIIL